MFSCNNLTLIWYNLTCCHGSPASNNSLGAREIVRKRSVLVNGQTERTHESWSKNKNHTWIIDLKTSNRLMRRRQISVYCLPELVVLLSRISAISLAYFGVSYIEWAVIFSISKSCASVQRVSSELQSLSLRMSNSPNRTIILRNLRKVTNIN